MPKNRNHILFDHSPAQARAFWFEINYGNFEHPQWEPYEDEPVRFRGGSITYSERRDLDETRVWLDSVRCDESDRNPGSKPGQPKGFGIMPYDLFLDELRAQERMRG